VTGHRLEVDRAQVLAFRRYVGALDARLPPGAGSLAAAAHAGLQDSMPRAALLSLHARVEATGPGSWEGPALAQLWGPRYSAYVVAAADRATFTLGRMPDGAAGRRRAEELADRLEAFLAGRRMTYAEAGAALGVHPNGLRYAAPTGRVAIRWDGARQPTVWTVPAPDVDPADARLELARRHLHVFGPSTAPSFARWAGVTPAHARATFQALAGSLVPVRTPLGDSWVLANDEDALRTSFRRRAAPARLLPSGDTFFLLQGPDRQLLVPDPLRRHALWTSRVWPGAVLVDGEVVGTWRRTGAVITLQPWGAPGSAARLAVEAEAAALPLPGHEGDVRTRWEVPA
jgi:hypothetical protein